MTNEQMLRLYTYSRNAPKCLKTMGYLAEHHAHVYCVQCNRCNLCENCQMQEALTEAAKRVAESSNLKSYSISLMSFECNKQKQLCAVWDLNFHLSFTFDELRGRCKYIFTIFKINK